MENIIERTVTLSTGEMIDAEDITLDISRPKATTGATTFLPEGVSLEQWEDEMIKEALRRTNGNKSQAARLLGLSRNALRYRLSKMGLPDEDAKD